MELNTYRKKRSFSLTPEPIGNTKKKLKKPIFSVQYHEARRTHYDLRLSYKGVLMSWAIPKGPSYDTSQRRLAVKVEDHPLEYADFEGEIPKGQYGGGTVTLWDRGFYATNGDFEEGLKKGALKFTLYGERLKGNWTLVKIGKDTNNENWLLIKEKDEFSAAPPDISDTSSILNKSSSKANPFKDFSTKQAQSTSAIPQGQEWIYEIKYDGYRATAVIEQGKVALLTRNGHDVTEKFAPIATALQKIMGERCAIFDGEAVVIKDGKTDFGALQHLSSKDELSYCIFDLLALDGEDLRPLPFAERRKNLEKLLKNAPQVIVLSKIFDNGQALYDAAVKMNLEGIVCKRTDASYYDSDWLKVKCRNRQEFVICGYTEGKKEIASLLLGIYREGKLEYVGNVGTGISSKNVDMLKKEFSDLNSQSPTLQIRKKDVHWLKPVLMAEVEFAEWTSSGKIRQASFKGIRRDKSAQSVKNEDPNAILSISISNPQKIIFTDPQVTKMDIARYYQSVADLMLPYLVDRPISVLRCNSGIEKCFYKKHPGSDKSQLIYINSPVDIIREVQLGTVEFHIQCHADKRSLMVFDLDPDEKLPLSEVRQCVLDLKEALDSLGLNSYLKLSGGKGYHIIAPMIGSTEPQEFSSFAKSIARFMAVKYPDLYTANIKKDKRNGKIFIDWQRNTPSATVIAPYSLRARKGASISLPISWSELNKYTPNEVNIFMANDILKHSWPDFWKQ